MKGDLVIEVAQNGGIQILNWEGDTQEVLDFLRSIHEKLI